MDKKQKKDKTVESTNPPKDTTKDKETAKKPTDTKENKEVPKDAPKDAKDVQKDAQKKPVPTDASKRQSAKKADPKSNIKQTIRAGGRRATKLSTKKEPEKVEYLHFGRRIIDRENVQQDLDDNTFLKYSVIGVLFTGSWVPPAKEFMPQLEQLYKEVNAEEKVFEIIQISSEKSEKDFKEAMTENRNWLYIPFNDGFMPKLVENFKVEFLPKLIIVNRTLDILSDNGRKDIIDLGTKAYDKWYKKYREIKEKKEKEEEENDIKRGEEGDEL